VQEAASGPIFVVGCPRSGTTLVQAILNAHPDISIAPETHFARRYLAGAPMDPDRVVTEFVASAEFRDTGLDPDEFRAIAARTRGGVADILLALLRAYGARRGAKVIGEKTPNHLLHMRLLEQSLPGARFVHVMRDPRAVALSMRSVPWSKGSVDRDAETWRRYMVAARERPPRRPGTLHEVRFERLLLEPEPTVRALIAFLGLAYRPELLDAEYRRSGAGDVGREPWKAAAEGPFEPGQVDRWKRTLSAPQIRAVEAVTYTEMRRLGYPPVTPAWRLLPLATFVALRRAWRLRGSRRRSNAART
jgi:hypothetical protein